MFADSKVFYTEFKSGHADGSRRDRASKTAQIQTEPLFIREGGIQTVRRKTVEVQTDVSAAHLDEDQSQYYDNGGADMPNDDPSAINAFARRIGPIILTELEANASGPATAALLGNWATARGGRSHRQIEVDAFGFAIVEDGQNQQAAAQQSDNGCTLLRRTFGPNDSSSSAIGSVNLPASSLSWSPSGASLAVAFGHINHDSWCNHGATSAVYIWSLETFRSNQSSSANNNTGEKQNYQPTRTLPHSACVTAVSFHPSQAGLLASGSFTGDVVVWDISGDETADPLLASTSGTALAQPGVGVPHTDFIGEIIWLPMKSSSSTTVRCLASACGDTLVCTWAVDVVRRTITQIAGYKFPAGVCCLSLNPHDSTTLASGLANGQLVFWALINDQSKSTQQNYALDPSRSTPQTPVYTVTGSRISAASGPLYGCEWSPACPGLCVVATSEGPVLLYSQRDPTLPCLRLECSNSGSLFSISFCRNRPLLLLASSQYEGALIFDLASSRASSALFRLQSSQNAGEINNQALSTQCAAFNPGSGRSSVHSLIAVGRESGAIELWRVTIDADSNSTETDAVAALRALVSGTAQSQQQQQQPVQKSSTTKPSSDSNKKKKKY